MDEKLAFASARALAAMVREKKTSAVELLDFFLARVERLNPRINAVILQRADEARKEAAACDAMTAKGQSLGPLHGVPMTVKESFDVAGTPSTWGLTAHRDNIAKEDALSVARLKAAGAIVFGKTNVPVWLADWQSFNPIYGTTSNPWNVERTPGGSSGGSAAALAAGLTGLELGSDIGASIRNPAHYCGVYGHKPTFDICPRDGHLLPGAYSHGDLAVIGPLARSAYDLEMALDIIAGPNSLDATGLRLELPRSDKTQSIWAAHRAHVRRRHGAGRRRRAKRDRSARRLAGKAGRACRPHRPSRRSGRGARDLHHAAALADERGAGRSRPCQAARRARIGRRSRATITPGMCWPTRWGIANGSAGTTGARAWSTIGRASSRASICCSARPRRRRLSRTCRRANAGSA
ncbi:MAG: amidase family protein [Rhodoblastus sp.]